MDSGSERKELKQRRKLEFSVHLKKTAGHIYYASRQDKIVAWILYISLSLIGLAYVILSVWIHMIVLGIILFLLFALMDLLIFSRVSYRRQRMGRITFFDDYVKYSAFAYRDYFHGVHHNVKISYSNVEILYRGPCLSCFILSIGRRRPSIDDVNAWNENYGADYITACREDGYPLFTMAYREEAWDTLLQVCPNAQILQGKDGLAAYMENRKKIEKETAAMNGEQTILDSYSGFVN